MARRESPTNELVKCEYCGEMYSVTYKQCPFCNGDGTGRWDDLAEDEAVYEGEPRAAGGKRLSGGGDKPPLQRVISTVVSLALIIAAAVIVISIVRSLFGDKDKDPTANATPTPSTESVAPAPSAPAESLPAAQPTAGGPAASQPPVESQPAAPQVSTPSVDPIAPTGFTLNRSDFTLDHVGETFQMAVAYTPADARGDITWKSSDANVASVSWNGTVTAVSQGTVTVTATVAGVGEKSCIVRCNFKDTATSAAPAESAAPSGSSDLRLSRDDFTLSFAGDHWRLTVSGASSTVTWASSDESVATVASDGTVTAVGAGTCRVTATVDGQTLKCIVRCSF